jgi:hypothetical protein
MFADAHQQRLSIAEEQTPQKSTGGDKNASQHASQTVQPERQESTFETPPIRHSSSFLETTPSLPEKAPAAAAPLEPPKQLDSDADQHIQLEPTTMPSSKFASKVEASKVEVPEIRTDPPVPSTLQSKSQSNTEHGRATKVVGLFDTPEADADAHRERLPSVKDFGLFGETSVSEKRPSATSTETMAGLFGETAQAAALPKPTAKSLGLFGDVSEKPSFGESRPAASSISKRSGLFGDDDAPSSTSGLFGAAKVETAKTVKPKNSLFDDVDDILPSQVSQPSVVKAVGGSLFFADQNSATPADTPQKPKAPLPGAPGAPQSKTPTAPPPNAPGAPLAKAPTAPPSNAPGAPKPTPPPPNAPGAPKPPAATSPGAPKPPPGAPAKKDEANPFARLE